MPRQSYPRLRIITASSVVATQLPHAVGCALAARLPVRTLSLSFFGDGAVSKGDFHEALSFAGIHRLPVVFFRKQLLRHLGSLRNSPRWPAWLTAAYGFPGVSVDGNDPGCLRSH